MPKQVHQRILDPVDRLTDRCIEQNILSIKLKDGTTSIHLKDEVTLDTSFERNTLADHLEKIFRAEIEGTLQRLYGGDAPETIKASHVRGFQQLAVQMTIADLQARIKKRLEERIADRASELADTICARKKTWEPGGMPASGAPGDAAAAQKEPRLFLWL